MRSLWEESADAWIEFSDHDPNRKLLLDPVMLRLAGDVRGKAVCDVGSGEGRFCRMLSAHGADVVGVEPTRHLVAHAHGLDRTSRYIRAGAESIPLADRCFDLVISYLVLIDIPDFRRAMLEMTRILKPGGSLLVANLNSFCTTRPSAWVKDETGEPLYVRVDDYFEERGDTVGWCGIEVINYHRPFQAYMQAFLEQGLRLVNFEEPRLKRELVREHPRMADAQRIPLFHVMQWQRA